MTPRMAELERDIEIARADLARKAQALRDRLRPRRLGREALASPAGQTAVNTVVPLAMLALALALASRLARRDARSYERRRGRSI